MSRALATLHGIDPSTVHRRLEAGNSVLTMPGGDRVAELLQPDTASSPTLLFSIVSDALGIEQHAPEAFFGVTRNVHWMAAVFEACAADQRTSTSPNMTAWLLLFAGGYEINSLSSTTDNTSVLARIVAAGDSAAASAHHQVGAVVGHLDRCRAAAGQPQQLHDSDGHAVRPLVHIQVSSAPYRHP